jgi:DNA end-binding protein Ku
MSARAMWKASLELGGASIPVKLYAAAQDRDIHFRLLHAKDRAPVEQRMLDPHTGEEIPAEAVQRGVAVEPGVYVVLKPEELEAGTPEPSRSIEITRFVPPQAIDAAWYSRPYYLGPDGSAAEYAALVKALRESGLRGVARWTMRKRRHAGVLEAGESHLALISLRPAEEVVAATQLEAPPGKPGSAAERELAEQLVAALDAPFDPRVLRNEYRERLEQYLEAKAQGKRVRAPREAIPAPSTDLARALKQSLEAARRSRRAA